MVIDLSESISGLQFGDLLCKLNIYKNELSSFLIESGYHPHYVRAITLKTLNSFLCRYQYQRRHTYLAARPLGLIVDPSNSCHLKCPGCIHSEILRKTDSVDWPSGLLDQTIFSHFMAEFAPYAMFCLFFNWGEPFLNKNFYRFIRQAKEYYLYTVVSSNLSVSIDAEEIVRSGLDYLTVSLDGATAVTYQRYRRGGDFELVVENIRNIVAAKKRLGISTPNICWQFLTFQHNCREMEKAEALACKLGVNEINFAQPYDVSWGDPGIKVFQSPPGRKLLTPENVKQRIVPFHEFESLPLAFDDAFDKGFSHQLSLYKAGNIDRFDASVCKWLYQGMIMDAHGRIFPCCYAPQKNSDYEYVFSQVDPQKTGEDHFNSENYLRSRQFFAGGKGLENSQRKESYCTVCTDRKDATNVDTEKIRRYLFYYDTCLNEQVGKETIFDSDAINYLTNWD